MDKSTTFGFGQRLRAARENAGLSGIELGKGAGENGRDASKQSVSDWENDRHYPKADQLRLICMKLNISADFLIFGDIKRDEAVAKAADAVRVLDSSQRRALMATMLGDAVADGDVARHLPPAPKLTPAKRGNKA